jgi:hypothetical protein
MFWNRKEKRTLTFRERNDETDVFQVESHKGVLICLTRETTNNWGNHWSYEAHEYSEDNIAPNIAAHKGFATRERAIASAKAWIEEATQGRPEII